MSCIATSVKMLSMAGSTFRESQRGAIQAWMREVMRINRWSAKRWAEKAHTSPSNITRFLKEPDASLPTWGTMTKLAAVSPIPAPQIESAPEDQRTVNEEEDLLIDYRSLPDAEREIVRLLCQSLAQRITRTRTPRPAKGGLR